MNHYLSLGFICSVLLVSLAVFCAADEAPSYLVYVQGGECSLTEGTNGTYVITVNDVIPFVHFAEGNKSSLIPVEQLTKVTYPLNAELVFSGTDNETFMVEISDLSISDGNKTLTLQAKALEFYEGSVLKTFACDNKTLKIDTGKDERNTGLYLEIIGKSPNNGDSWTDCITRCQSRGTPYGICWKICDPKE